MADGDISLLAIYDKVASVDTKVESLGADVRAQLAHGQRRMEDHETRIRQLESTSEQRRGVSSAWTLVLSIATSSGASAAIAWLLTRHP